MRFHLLVTVVLVILLSSQLPVRNGQAESFTDEFPSENSGHSFGSLARSLKMAAKVSVEWSDDGVKGLSKYMMRNGATKADDIVRALGTNADDVFRISSKSSYQLGDDALLAIEKLVADGSVSATKWSDDAMRGLGNAMHHNLDDVTKIFASYSDEVAESTMKGVGKGVIDVRNVDVDDLARYIDEVYDGDIVNAFDSVLKDGTTNVDAITAFKTAKLKDGNEVFVVMKKGRADILGADDKWYGGFGREHIKFKHIDGNVPKSGTSLFLDMTEDEIMEVIYRGLKETPAENIGGVTKLTYKYPNNLGNPDINHIIIVVDTSNGNSITTAFPVYREGYVGPGMPWG